MDKHEDSHWIPLTEYSSRYKVSISTLRRRIKGGLIPVRLQTGKYFLKAKSKMFAPQSPAKLPVFPSPAYEKTFRSGFYENLSPAPQAPPDAKRQKFSEEDLAPQKLALAFKKLQTVLHKNEKVLNKLLHFQEDLEARLKAKNKKIQEQDNQISDLKTLLNLLEAENRELKAFMFSHRKEAEPG